MTVNTPNDISLHPPDLLTTYKLLAVRSYEPVRHGPGSRSGPGIAAVTRLLPHNFKNLIFFARKLINYFEVSHVRHDTSHAAIVNISLPFGFRRTRFRRPSWNKNKKKRPLKKCKLLKIGNCGMPRARRPAPVYAAHYRFLWNKLTSKSTKKGQN